MILLIYFDLCKTDANPHKKMKYEQHENEENLRRCSVALLEFYKSRCVKTRNKALYFQPDISCVPDSPVWYSSQALSPDALQRMLHRVKMIHGIN
ncbi:zinc finger MYM-type protein 4-like [Drosophila sulfurigaster albostrigata]|uniref:zinc finger MYM-type protein 4-like n=1 Tax=Drosophila sulfurigaster albostrigata TaxID=89887 RepID=UPI002D21AF1D|nr:zinc finger MYM-type protein 4-like [Drosophila sulfurigaster albostrigata]